MSEITETAGKRASPITDALLKFYRSAAPRAIIFAIGPVLMYILVEYLNGTKAFSQFSALQVLLNLCFYYTIFFILYLAIGRIKIASGLGAVFFLFVGVANHYIYGFRGKTIFPGDLITLKTAFSVAGDYDYTPDKTVIIAIIIVLVYIGLILALPRRKGRRLPKLPVTLTASILSASFIFIFFCTGFLSWSGIKPSMWTTRGNGFILNFCVALKLSMVKEPPNYTTAALASIIDEYSGGETPKPVTTVPENIIVIMNESYSDLSVLGDFETSMEYMSFYDSLSENTIKGNAYSSVFGGTTANSEYEFLTGNSMSFFPDGIVPYQMYIKNDATSLVAQLEKEGYTPIAMHPYLSAGWNRVQVYDIFGFDEVLFQSDFTKRTYMRNYITDQCDYENLARIVSEKEEGEKLFIFNVTMQNHSGYAREYSGLPHTAKLSGDEKGKYPGVDQYLSLIKQSDIALEYLIDYFKGIDEPTLILMFGDHQPQVEKGFFEKILGGKLTELPLDKMQKRQMVPYIFWANYDIEEHEGKDTSLNYLATDLLDIAGLQKTKYQHFLSELREKLPIVNSLGYRAENGEDYLLGSELPEPYKSYLQEYQYLQYNNVFGGKNRISDFFWLSPDDIK